MSELRPRHLMQDDPVLMNVLTLIQTALAAMDGVVDPPSSVHRLTMAILREAASQDEVWAIGGPPLGCMILTLHPDTLYLSKLAVARFARGQGIARRLVACAAYRARELGKPSVTLQTRIELTDNQATFRALGFSETGRTRHPGYSHDTSITFTLPA